MKSTERVPQNRVEEDPFVRSLIRAASVDADTIYHFLSNPVGEALAQARGFSIANGETLNNAEEMLRENPEINKSINLLTSLVRIGTDRRGELETSLEIARQIDALIKAELKRIKEEVN